MRRLILINILIFIIGNTADAWHYYPENHYQSQWCGKWHGKIEYKLKDNTRVDCLTKNYAVEFDFASKWAESIGQSLYYGKMTGKHPAVILIIEKPSDWKYYHRLNKIAKDYNITVWYIKSPVYDGKTPPKAEKDNFKIISDFFKSFLENLQ